MLKLKSPIYWHPSLYDATMRLLYGAYYDARHAAVAACIPVGSDVFEVCAGTGILYRHYLKSKGVLYRGSDLNPSFVDAATRARVPITLADLRTDPLPPADIIIMQASLYQFMPHCRVVLNKLRSSARHQLIIAEPVINVASSTNKLTAWLASRAADIGEGAIPFRFDLDQFDTLMREVFIGAILHEQLLPGGREKLYCVATSG